MAKAQEFKDELGINTSPRIFKKGYLFKEIGEDSNGNISSFHDEKTFYKGFYDHDVFGIFSDLHFSKWDHSYGTTHHCNTVFPDDAQFFEEAWTQEIPAGTAGTPALFIGGTSGERGTFRITCTSAQTLTYKKNDIIDDTSTSTGCFTLEYSYKKNTAGSEVNANPFTVQIKFGQFHVQVIHNLSTIVFKEVGTAGTTLTHTNQSTVVNVDDGHYNVMRVIFDMQRATKKCVLLINDQERGSFSKTQTNGSTTDNEVKFGYFAVPTSISNSNIKYIRYHNTAFYPLEVPIVHTCPIGVGLVDDSGTQGTDTIFTKTGTFSTRQTALDNDTDQSFFSTITNAGSSPTLVRNNDFSTNAIGNAFEVNASVASSPTAAAGRLEFKMEDGTRSCKLELFSVGHSTLPNTVQFNGVTVSGVVATTAKVYRVVMRGTGASSAINCWLYINGELVASQSNTTASANNRFTVTQDVSVANYFVQTFKLFNRPQFPTRQLNNCYVAYLNGISEASTRYYSSQVTLNDLDDLLATPKLASLAVFQKDLSWGDCGFHSVDPLEQRSSNTVFLNNAVSPAFSAITPNTDLPKRDATTKYMTDYFQIRIPFTKITNELTFMRFHRQLDVSDYVTTWGQSTFERDFISRKINAGDLRVELMNPDDDFDSLRQRPDIWINAVWETWIGAHTNFGDFEYPDFIGKVENIIFQSNPAKIQLEITNIIKQLKDIEINPTLQYPPFTKLNTFAGSTCNSIAVRQDTVDNTVFFVDSKYDLVVSAVYVNNVVQSSGFVTGYKSPVKIDFTTAPSGTVTVDLVPKTPFNTHNAGTLIRNILQKEANLFLSLNVNVNSIDEFEGDIDGISIKNIILSGTKLFDFLEKLAIQSSGDLFISPDTQDEIGIDLTTNVNLFSETISDRHLSPSFHNCTTITINNPIENVINSVDFTFDTETVKQNFSYINRRLVSDYDAASPLATRKIIDVFGQRSPSRRITNNPNTFFNIITHYDLLDSVTDLQTVVDRNFAPFGYRPPIYQLNDVHTNIFIYSFRDVLLLMRNSATIADDSLEITRIAKDYDNHKGSIEGFSNKFIQFGGGIASLLKTYAAPDTVCAASVTSPCDVTGKTLNPVNPLDANSYFVATDIATDPDVSFAGT